MYILRTTVYDEMQDPVPLQVEHMGLNYRWDDPDSVTRMVSGPLAVTPNLNAFHLSPLTTRTDLVRQGYIYASGLLASEEFCEALQGMRVQPHARYSADVVHHGTSYRYHWIHITNSLEGRIDFARSAFGVRKPGGAWEPAHISDPPSLRQFCLHLVNVIDGGELVPRLVRFLPGTSPYDLSVLRLTDDWWLVSDRLAERLQERGLTGFELVPPNAALDVSFESEAV